MLMWRHAHVHVHVHVHVLVHVHVHVLVHASTESETRKPQPAGTSLLARVARVAVNTCRANTALHSSQYAPSE